MKFLRISSAISELIGKMIFSQFSFSSYICDVISPPFAYQDSTLHITSFSTLNANILRTIRDIEEGSTAFFPILSYLSFENYKFWGLAFPLK